MFGNLFNSMFGKPASIRAERTPFGFHVEIDKQLLRNCSKDFLDAKIDELCRSLSSYNGSSGELTLIEVREPQVRSAPTRKEIKAHRKQMQGNYYAQHPSETPKLSNNCMASEVDHTFEEGFSGYF